MNFKNIKTLFTFASQELLKNADVKPEFLKQLLLREKEYPTGLFLSNGITIALPHVSAEFVNSNLIFPVFLEQPILFKNMGNCREKILVDKVFFLIIKNPKMHLDILSKLIDLMSKKENCKNYESLKSNEDLYEFLNQLFS